MPADPKPARRIVDPKAMRAAVVREPWCVICKVVRSETAHHILSRSLRGDDVPACLVALDGSGTTGCHGRVEARDPEALLLLGEHVTRNRPDTMEYLARKLGGPVARAEWLRRHLFVESA